MLQVRKSLECLAFAAIAPNKAAYERLRLAADEPADFRKDFNARKILQLLSELNADFYPMALLPQGRQTGGQWHFERKPDGDFAPLRFVPDHKTMVLGLVTTKLADLESPRELIRRIEEAARYVPLDHLCLSPQRGFSSTVEGNQITEEDQWAKLELVSQVACDV